MSAQELIGYAAAILTTLSFVPQAVLTLRTRDVSGISLGMYSCFTLGIALWLAYGLSLGQWPLIIANAITLALASTILLTKLRYRRPRKSDAPADGSLDQNPVQNGPVAGPATLAGKTDGRSGAARTAREPNDVR